MVVTLRREVVDALEQACKVTDAEIDIVLQMRRQRLGTSSTVTLEGAAKIYELDERRLAATFEQTRRLGKGWYTVGTANEGFMHLSDSVRVKYCQGVKQLQTFINESFIGDKDVKLRHRILADYFIVDLAWTNFKRYFKARGAEPPQYYAITSLCKALKSPHFIVSAGFPTFQEFGIWREYLRIQVSLQDKLSSRGQFSWMQDVDADVAVVDDNEDSSVIDFQEKLRAVKREGRPRMPRRERPRMPKKD